MSETRAPCAISGDLHILRSCYKLRDKIYNGYADFKKPTLELLKIKLKFPSPWRKNQTSITLKQMGLQSGFSYFACSCNFAAVASLPDKIDFFSSLQSYSGRYEDPAKRDSAPQAGKREHTESFTRSRNMVSLFFLSLFFFEIGEAIPGSVYSHASLIWLIQTPHYTDEIFGHRSVPTEFCPLVQKPTVRTMDTLFWSKTHEYTHFCLMIVNY